MCSRCRSVEECLLHKSDQQYTRYEGGTNGRSARVRIYRQWPIASIRSGGTGGTERVANGRLIRFARNRTASAAARGRIADLASPGDLNARMCCAPARVRGANALGCHQLGQRALPLQRFTSLRLCFMHHYVFDYGRLVASVASALSSMRIRRRRCVRSRRSGRRVIVPRVANECVIRPLRSVRCTLDARVRCGVERLSSRVTWREIAQLSLVFSHAFPLTRL